MDVDVADRIFAHLCALLGGFNAVNHGVAQQVFKGSCDAIND